MIVANSVLVFQIILSSNVVGHLNEEDVDTAHALSELRINLVFCIILNMLELFSRIRIFDFFAYFVRQCTEICKDAMPLASMLGIIVLT